MMGEFIMGVLNTSVVMGLGIAAAGILLKVSGKGYSAGCRKRIWIFLALCLLIPFHLFRIPGAYTAEIPDVVLREFDTSAAHGTGGQGMTNSSQQTGQDQIAQSQTMQGQSGQALAPWSSGQGEPKTELTVADVCFAVWMSVGVLMSVYFAAGYRRMQSRIRRWSRELGDGHVQEAIAEAAAECKLKRIPKIRIMKDSQEGPFTTGVLKNIIILPDDALDERDLRFILKNEMIHCRNHDIAWRLFFLIVNIIHWFNPLVWYLRRAAEQDMEIACDEGVVTFASREDRREYGDVILSWVERSSYRGNAVSTGYVNGGKFLKRRFDNIFNGGKKKNGILLSVGVCVLALLTGCVIQLQNGSKVYAKKKIAIDHGYEVRTDVDGDGEVDMVLVSDNNLVGWDSDGDYMIETQLSVYLGNGEDERICYPERWDSYVVTGDLSGNGAADIVLVKIAWGSSHGTGEVKVLHVETDETGKPEWVEYPSSFIKNPNLEPKWVDWENYTDPAEYIENKDSFAEQPTDFGSIECQGAAIIEKDGKTMLRLVYLVDGWTDSSQCIDCIYTEDGWYIEDMWVIYAYGGSKWEDELLGTLEMKPGEESAAVPKTGGGETEGSEQEDLVRMQVFTPEEVKVTPEIELYDFESACKLGEVRQLHGTLPGAAEGTWYIITIDGVEYYYGRYDHSSDRTQLFGPGYAIVGKDYSLANGISVGMTKDELLERYPNMRIEDTEGNVIDGIGEWTWWNHTAYPRSPRGMDEEWDYGGAEYYYWDSQFDYIMIAEIEQPPDTMPAAVALMMKEDTVSAITFYWPTAG